MVPTTLILIRIIPSNMVNIQIIHQDRQGINHSRMD